MTATERISEVQKALNDLNSTARLVRFLADNVPVQCHPSDPGDPHLCCVFEVIADRLDAVDEVLEVARMLEASERPGPRLVDQGGEP